ncbi:hypothetical protein MRX96_000892 [Rhipicephalus microplus]
MNSLASDDLLIEEVRRRPLLYDQRLKTYRVNNFSEMHGSRCPEYSDKAGTVYFFSLFTRAVPDIEHRRHSLRQKFLRLRKAYVKYGSGSDAVKKKWALFDNLVFLNDSIQSRRQAI